MALGDWSDPIHVTKGKDDAEGCGCLLLIGFILALLSAPFCLAGCVAAEKGVRRSDSCFNYVGATWDNVSSFATKVLQGTGQALDNFDRND